MGESELPTNESAPEESGQPEPAGDPSNPGPSAAEATTTSATSAAAATSAASAPADTTRDAASAPDPDPAPEPQVADHEVETQRSVVPRVASAQDLPSVGASTISDSRNHVPEDLADAVRASRRQASVADEDEDGASNEEPREEEDDGLANGSMIGGCRIEQKVGQGGMGAVYRATQVALEKTVAVKVLSRHLASNPDFTERFLREARLAARLEHENIVQVFDTGTEDGHSYIVMQFVDGDTLRDRVRKGPIGVDMMLSYFSDSAAGLDAAHKRKVIHRDVKPENLIITADDRIKVADFGLAQESEEFPEGEDPTAGVMASAHYMSPEHADLRPVDARSDLYSLGVSMFSIATGRRLFVGESHLELVLRHHLETPAPVTMYRREVPLTVSAIIGKLLQKLPDERYESADELLDDLKLIDKRQLPKVPNYWASTSMTPPRVDPMSIARGGVGRALDIQRAMKARGDQLISLGQLMTANNFVEMKPADENRYPAELPFLWSHGRELPADLHKHYAGHPDEFSLAEFASRPASPGNPAMARLTRGPLLVTWDGEVLRLELLLPFPDAVAVQHYYDLLMVFPFIEAPEVVVVLDSKVHLAIQDVPWLVDSHNLIGRRSGRFRVQARDDVTMAFFTGHHLDQYLDVTLSPREDDLEQTQVMMGTPADLINADSEAITAEVSPLDEARSYLATSNPLAARQVLAKVLATPAGAGDAEVKELAREVADTLVENGIECLEAEDYDGAKEWFDHAISICADHADACLHKATALKKLGQLEYALRYMTEAIRLRPDDPELYYNRAIIYARAGQMKEAIADLDVTVKMNPRHANAYYNRGIAWEKLKDLGRARQDYLLALKLNNRFARVLTPRLKRLSQRRARASRGDLPAVKDNKDNDGKAGGSSSPSNDAQPHDGDSS